MKSTAGSLKPALWGLHLLLTLIVIMVLAIQPASTVNAQDNPVLTPTLPAETPTPTEAAVAPTQTSTPTELPDLSGFATADAVNSMGQAVSTMAEIDETQVDFVDKKNGYLYLNSKLFWTSNGGGSWSNITPPDFGIPNNVSIQFLDQASGAMLADMTQEDGDPVFILYTTIDGGENWASLIAGLPFPADESLSFESFSIFFIDGNTGWISLKLSSSSNFSRGMLFRTDDAGASWSYQAAPLGGLVYFANPASGWMAGGPSGDQLFSTQDGGASWQPVELPEIDTYPQASIQLPHFFDETDGLLPVAVGDEAFTQLLLYASQDNGSSWTLESTLDIEPTTAVVPISYTARDLKKILVASDKSILASDGKSSSRVKAEKGLSSTPKKLAMLTDQAGFSEVAPAKCEAENPGGNGKIHCQKEYQLLGTDDGGKTWSPVVLPEVNATMLKATQDFSVETITSANDITAASENAQTMIGQGFDKCDVASYDQLLTWMQTGPYRAVNLYIGGISRACSNSPLTSSFVHAVSLQGWKFIPTWVGPQAPCSGLKYPMSWDPNTAYGQGVDNAIQAVEALYLLGLTTSSKTGGVVYYDMEYYNGNDAACAAAVKSFMNGWTAQIKAMGDISGVYGTTSLNQLNNIFSVPNPPQVIWPARWNYPSYSPDASVWEIPDLSNDIYKYSQRIRQYAGGHDETWGNIRLNIDSNVLDGVVAVPLVNQPSLCPPTTNSQSYICSPLLVPTYVNTCESGWYPIVGFNGLTTYLSESVVIPSIPTNVAFWTPNLLSDGYYRVEAFIASHGSANVNCPSGIKTYGKDSSVAYYTITDKAGTKTVVAVDQLPVNNDWVNLGSYFFGKGSGGGDVVLGNATGDPVALSTNISVGAVRFVAIDPKITSISPVRKLKGEGAFTLTVNGYNFNATSTLQWNGSNRPTTFVSSNKITAQITSADIATIGVNLVSVLNTSEGNIASVPVKFGVTTFADVPIDAWNWRYIEGFYAKGITSGCGTNPSIYCPTRRVTRGEMAVFLLLAMNPPGYQPSPTQTGFITDIPVAGKEWMQPWIEQFYQEGITSGCSSSPLMYCPERAVTRAEMAVFILKAVHGAGYVPPAATGIFSDVPVKGKEWMTPWIEEFYREGISSGCGTTPLSFCPERSVTRGEMAVFIDVAFGFPPLP